MRKHFLTFAAVCILSSGIEAETTPAKQANQPVQSIVSNKIDMAQVPPVDRQQLALTYSRWWIQVERRFRIEPIEPPRLERFRLESRRRRA